MSTVVIAKIQNRRGLRRDLPQPLDPGEIGLCIDTGQMFIGADPEDPHSVQSKVIELFDDKTPTEPIVNGYLQNQIIQYNFLDTDEMLLLDELDPLYEQSKNDLNDREEAIRVDLFNAYNPQDISSEDQVKIVKFKDRSEQYTYVDLNGQTQTGYRSYYWFRGYVIVDSPSLPPIPYNVRGAPGSYIFNVNGILFNEGALSYDSVSFADNNGNTRQYNVDDMGAIASIINDYYEELDGNGDPIRPGIVTVDQNIEICTEYGHCDFDKDFAESSVILPGNTTVWMPVPNNIAKFNLAETNSVKIMYSLSDGNVVSGYNRVGEWTITASGNTAILTDEYNFVDNTANDISVDFRTTVDIPSVTFEVEYITNSQTPDLTLTIFTKTWLSF